MEMENEPANRGVSLKTFFFVEYVFSLDRKIIILYIRNVGSSENKNKLQRRYSWLTALDVVKSNG